MMPIFWFSPSLYQTVGPEIPMPWGYFSERVEHAREAPSKEGLARWAPVEFRDAKRCLANVIRAHAVVLDVDDGSVLDTIVAALEGLFVIAHSTFSATPEQMRMRVVVPLDEPVDAEGYDRVWRWLALRLEVAGAQPDYGARDASRAWAVPARPPSGFYVANTIDGAFANVREAFAAIPKPEPLPTSRAEYMDSDDRRLDRASRYLAAMPAAISGSGGHRATFAAACALVRGFALSEDDALALLVAEFNPRCAPMWSIRDLRHKVRQAHQRARLPFGFLAERTRDGRAA
jgi:hypothetical protein